MWPSYICAKGRSRNREGNKNKGRCNKNARVYKGKKVQLTITMGHNRGRKKEKTDLKEADL